LSRSHFILKEFLAIIPTGFVNIISFMSIAIWWIRRDLRLSDNPALIDALKHHQSVFPLFILDEALLKQSSSKRNSHLFAALNLLEQDLISRGSRLIVRRGKPIEVLPAFIVESKSKNVYAQRDFSSYAVRRDSALSKVIPLTFSDGLTIFPPDAVKKSDGSFYSKFTPFSNAWKALPQNLTIIPAPDHLPDCPLLSSEELPLPEEHLMFTPGEEPAHERLQDFIREDIFNYSTLRDRMDLDRTSHLSVALKFGLISVREAHCAANQALELANNPQEKESCQIWINELIWRDFFYQIMTNHPQVLKPAFNPVYRQIHWNKDKRDLQAWQSGQTGYPIIDAAMRQLNNTGWMHNRARMLVSSFLVKDLNINWQEGEDYFSKNLLDYDPASNNGNWQWAAGTGTDSVPYFRIFNPTLQSRKFDPVGVYIRRWLPELNELPNQFIHTPWQMTVELQNQSHCKIGRVYPAPIVDHQKAKTRTLALYRSVKKNS
jgi:deoxyribodipyrimidine photo-lyase